MFLLLELYETSVTVIELNRRTCVFCGSFNNKDLEGSGRGLIKVLQGGAEKWENFKLMLAAL
jgi:hypothetical protein